MTKVLDLAIIGGGINGCGLARDAAGRGLSVVLFEQGDLAGATSSASTKLVHGGLRYLEHYEFRLVREALSEREILLKLAPHIIWPLRFVLPHHKGLRPVWLLRLGLFLYDHLGGRKILPPTKMLDLRVDDAGRPLKAGYKTAFEYSDCWVEDSRLVVLNARDAAERGAKILTRTRVTKAERKDGHWVVTAQRGETGEVVTYLARILVNASGPWVADVVTGIVRANQSAGVRLVQGSHIVVPKVFAHDRSYIFQNGDGRIIFAIPYEQDFTLIGTTDQDYKGDPAAVHASAQEISYLCSAASEYFAKPVLPEQVVWTYSGVRPLYDDGASKAQEATRDYVLVLDAPQDQPPLLSVYGGKITTYRRLAEAVLDRLAPFLPASIAARKGWSGSSPLPGGDFPPDGYQAQVQQLLSANPWLDKGMARRLVRAYGTRAALIVEGRSDPGQRFGAGLSEAEVVYLIRQEWACNAQDILWRRSKLGLRLTTQQSEALEAFVQAWRANHAGHTHAA